jgi:hypothetical protein
MTASTQEHSIVAIYDSHTGAVLGTTGASLLGAHAA